MPPEATGAADAAETAPDSPEDAPQAAQDAAPGDDATQPADGAGDGPTGDAAAADDDPGITPLQARAAEDDWHAMTAPTLLEVRSRERREIGMRIVPWNVVADTKYGPEVFLPGAFDGTAADDVVLRLEHEDPAAGRGLELQQRADGAWMLFRAAKTQRGDEILTLADERVTRGASVGFVEVPGGTTVQTWAGRPRVRVHKRVGLREVSTTWRPVYTETADTLYTRSWDDDDNSGGTVPPEATAGAATPVDIQPVAAGVDVPALLAQHERLLDRFEALETRSRQAIDIPHPETGRTDRQMTGAWMQTVLRMLSGERVSDLQTRALAELITSDNLGVVPDAFLTELIGVIDPSRPFLQTTRELPTPDSGLSLQVPVLVTKPTVGVQAHEKDQVASTTTSISTTGFDAVTVAGGGDISLQLLKRSSPSYLDLYLQLLAEAYAVESEQLAVATLLDARISEGTGYIDPEDLTIGETWGNAVAAKLRPTHMWMSTAAVTAFIDAKADGSNLPLYSNLAADITVANGVQGLISGLRPVYVPALDGTGADVLVGPSRGFAWAEDGTYTLQVDVPSLAGRDVAIVGILWFAPLYPQAFTSYRLPS